VVAAILRLENIEQPFIDDLAWRQSSDAMMAENFYRKSWNIFYPRVNWTGSAPGYQGREFQTVTYLAALLYLFLGQQDWIGRSVALVFGLWGIFALYQLVRSVSDDRRAVIAAAVMALIPGGIMLERSFIPDPVMVALVTTSLWLFVRYLQSDSTIYLILAGVVGALGNLTKIPGLIVGLPMIYAALSILGRKHRLCRKRIVLMLTVAFASLLPVIAYYLWARHLALTYPPHHFAGEGNWLWDHGLKEWFKQQYFLPRLFETLKRMWTVSVVALAFIGLFFPPRDLQDVGASEDASFAKENSQKSPWLFHWWAAAGVVYYLIGALELLENPSNFHILSPAAAALCANAIMAITFFLAKRLAARGRFAESRFAKARFAKSRFAEAMIVLSILAVIAVSAYRGRRLHSAYAEESYRLGLALRAVSQPDELVVALGNAIGCPVAIYYSGRRGWLFPPFEETKDYNQLPDDDEAIRIFEKLRASGANWFGVVAERKERLLKDRPRFFEHVTRTCEAKQVSPWGAVYRILPL
jgi:hypothetical protein